MGKSISRVIFMAIIVVAVCTSLSAQQTGSIVGSVSDKTGAVLSRATVTLINAATKDVRHSTTNPEGFFAFSGVVVGNYSVKVDSQGFQTAELSGIHVGPGDHRNLNVSLAVGTANEQVVVTDASSANISDSGDLSSTLYAGNIRKLALQGRD